MNCTECQDVIHSFLDGELEGTSRVEVQSHLAHCADCSHELADWQTSLSELQRTFPDQAPPAALWDRIQARTMTPEVGE